MMAAETPRGERWADEDEDHAALRRLHELAQDCGRDGRIARRLLVLVAQLLGLDPTYSSRDRHGI
jgi:hypothetical protein